MHVATSYEHDETGFSSESFSMRTMQVDKRMKKLALLMKEIDAPAFYGPKKAEVTLVVWGSHKLSALDALPMLEREKITANVLHFTHVFPLDPDRLKKIFAGCKKP